MRVDSQRIPELDGLRGTAIGLVIVFHLSLVLPGIPHLLQRFMLFGWSGVDLFFVLSGFLIGGILIDHREAYQYFKPFYARRFFRIIPIYVLILGSYGLCWAIGGDVRYSLISTAGPPMPWYVYLTFTNNLWQAWHNTMNVFLPVTWSLAVEEQFYLTLPLIVRFVKPKFLPQVVFSITGVVIALRVMGAMSGRFHQNQLYVLPWFRADALMIGVICAMIIRNEDLRAYLNRNIWIVYGILLTVGAAVVATGGALPAQDASPNTPIMTFGLTLVGVGYGCLLLLCLLRPSHPSSWIMRASPLRYMGKLSYAVYLIHQALLGVPLDALKDMNPHASALWHWVAAGVAIAVIIGLAQLSWTVFESKLIPIGHRFKYSGAARKKAAVAVISPAASEESLAS